MADKLDKTELAETEGQLVIRKADKDEKKRLETPEDVPQYRIKLKLNEEQQERLIDQFTEEFKAIVEERKSLGLADKWREADNQYDGILRRNNKLAFNLHTHQSKIKCDAIVRALNEAFLDSRPMVDVSPRPEFWKVQEKSNVDVCQKQQQFLEFAMEEEIKPEQDILQINKCCVKKFVGIGKLEWSYEKEKRKREEVYEGKNEVVGQNPDGSPIVENKALKEFLGNYPDAEQKYPQYLRQLAEEKTVSIVVEYLDTLSNSPKITYVPIENFYTKNSTNGYLGLCKAHCIAELKQMSWWELKKKEANDEFENVDQLKDKILSENEKQESTQKDDYKTREYDILEATMQFSLNNVEGEEVKIKAWFSPMDNGMTEFVYLGCILYPYFGFDSDYVPFYIKINDDGFYGGCKSVIYDLRDSNIAQDAIMNLALHSMYVRNTLTPIVKEGSEIEMMFLENRWTDGKPLPVDALTENVGDALQFVNYPQISLQDFVVLGQQLKKVDSDVTGITDLMTGRESATDPRAPASKTIALLNQSGINIKDYIRLYLPSFNILIGNILVLYYQMSQSGKKFRVGTKGKQVTGMEVFEDIPRDAMVARTNIQARASSFAFDKVNEKQENLAAYQMIMASPLAMVQSDLAYKALRIALKTWSPTWANFVDTDLISPQEFQQKQFQVAMQAVAQVLMQAQQQQQITGVKQQVAPEQIVQAVTQQQAAAFNPAVAEAQAKAQKASK